MIIGNGYLSIIVFRLSGPRFTQRRSIPSPSSSFFPTTTTLAVYEFLDFSITPFLSISLIWFSIHSFSFGDLCLSLQVVGISSINLIACSIRLQFPMSWSPLDTMSWNSLRISSISSGFLHFLTPISHLVYVVFFLHFDG